MIVIHVRAFVTAVMDSRLALIFLSLCYVISAASYSNINATSNPLREDIYSYTSTSSGTIGNVVNRTIIAGTTPRPIVRRKWLTEIFLEAKTAFDVDPSVSPMCRRYFNLYKLNLQNQSVWAVRMAESSEWPSVGLFAGMIHHLGNYDECLLVSEFDFKGKYCMVRATYNFTLDESTEKNRFPWTSWPIEESSVWGAIYTFSHDYIRLNRQTINWALCIPSTCTVADLKTSLNRTLSPIFKKYSFDVKVDIDPIMCRVKETLPFTAGFFVVGGLIAVVIVLELCASIYDVKENGKYEASRFATIFRYFSVVYNYNILTKFSTKTTFSIFHVTKIIIASFVLTAHRIMFYFFFPVFNEESYEMLNKSIGVELLHTNIVDIFLCISGYTLYDFAFPLIRKEGIIFGIRYIIFRWMRLMAVPGIIILCVINLSAYLSDGPMSNFYVDKFVGSCESNWWATIFAMNNIVKPDQSCLPHTWYLSVDLQLSCLGIILLYVMSKRRKIGIVLAVLVTIASFVMVYYIIVTNKFPGLPLLNINFVRDLTKQPIFHLLFVTSYLRLGPYFVGFFAAIVTEKLKSIEYKFSTMRSIFLLVSLLLFSSTFLLYGFRFYDSDRPYDPVENAIYGCLNRTLFVLPYACLCCVYFTSGLGRFDNIFKRKGIIVCSRLSYCVYLLSPLFQLWATISQKTYMNVSNRLIAYWASTADIVWCFTIAFIVYLTIEGPTNNLRKYLERAITKRFERRLVSASIRMKDITINTASRTS